MLFGEILGMHSWIRKKQRYYIYLVDGVIAKFVNHHILHRINK